jgi:hypothetical protein
LHQILILVSGLGVVGRDKYGVYPLRGKLLNVREATHKQIMENKEINELVKIVGLQYKKKYLTTEDLKTLRYGRMMIMTDQDQVCPFAIKHFLSIRYSMNDSKIFLPAGWLAHQGVIDQLCTPQLA